MEPNNQHIDWEVLEKHFVGKASKEEEALLAAWLKADPANKPQYDELKTAFQMARDTLASGGPKKPPVFDAEKDWKAFKSRIEPQAKINSSLKSSSPKFSYVYWLAAAVAILLVGIGYLFIKPDTSAPLMVTVTAEANENKEVPLPDGSKVVLAPESSLSYPEKFDPSGRVVNLEGMAYFSVARDPRYTFTAHTPKATVTVLGTQFLIKGGDTPSVQVSYGKVKFASRKNPDASMILVKGEQAILENENAAPEKIALDPNDLSWKTGKLVYQGWNVADIIEELEKHYQVTVEVEDPEVLGETITVRVSANSVDEAFQTFGDEIELSVEMKGDSVLMR